MATLDDLRKRWDADLTPQMRRNLEREKLVWRVEFALTQRCFWLRYPPLQPYWIFWSALLEEGLRGAVDALCFSFLHDRNPAWRWCSSPEPKETTE